MSTKTGDERLLLDFTVKIPYGYPAGTCTGRAFKELRDNGKIYANICPKCGRGLAPPRPLCGRCHVRMGEWVEVGPKGTVLVFSVTEMSFWDPSTGLMRQVPYTHSIIALDGAPVAFQHFLEETNTEKLRSGMRVEAVFKPKSQRKGNILDILHFRTIEE